jgi:WD40 repeat protein
MHVPSSRRLALPAIGLLAVCPSLNGQHASPPQPKEMAVFRGHTNTVWGLDLTPDGQTVVSGSFDKTIKVWDVTTGKERFTLRGHTRCVEFVVVTPDGQTAVAADQGGVVRVWNLIARRERSKLAETGGRPAFLSLSADGCTLSLGDRNYYLRQWNLTTGKELAVGPAASADGGPVHGGAGAARSPAEAAGRPARRPPAVATGRRGAGIRGHARGPSALGETVRRPVRGPPDALGQGGAGAIRAALRLGQT